MFYLEQRRLDQIFDARKSFPGKLAKSFTENDRRDPLDHAQSKKHELSGSLSSINLLQLSDRLLFLTNLRDVFGRILFVAPALASPVIRVSAVAVGARAEPQIIAAAPIVRVVARMAIRPGGGSEKLDRAGGGRSGGRPRGAPDNRRRANSSSCGANGNSAGRNWKSHSGVSRPRQALRFPITP